MVHYLKYLLPLNQKFRLLDLTPGMSLKKLSDVRMLKKLLTPPLILLLIITISSCAIKQPVKKGGIRYASPADLEKCVRTETFEKTELAYHVLNEGETVYKLSRIYGISVERIIELNGIEDINDIPAGEKLLIEKNISGLNFSWPLRGIVTSGYGQRNGRFHHGIDIAARKGTSIRSSANGIVVLSGRNVHGFGGYGNIIALQHSMDTVSIYAHNRKNYVEYGQCVTEGEVIGEVGSTGRSTGPHLHFEIRKKNRSLNPHSILIRSSL